MNITLLSVQRLERRNKNRRQRPLSLPPAQRKAGPSRARPPARAGARPVSARAPRRPVNLKAGRIRQEATSYLTRARRRSSYASAQAEITLETRAKTENIHYDLCYKNGSESESISGTLVDRTIGRTSRATFVLEFREVIASRLNSKRSIYWRRNENVCDSCRRPQMKRNWPAAAEALPPRGARDAVPIAVRIASSTFPKIFLKKICTEKRTECELDSCTEGFVLQAKKKS
ncbi:hypothetical protein EVAR_47265_1 [Eumeta japonica]|uniref:Uncharacterized protein n=1 Tax=Eumeta variegata TaxID=151549 RepID=A0A4C1XH01_EUMVA|nr:hypothetical protein EVAR_47265_1 [Eumeta japonica]